MSTLPPLPGKIAIVLGFVLGTWTIVDGLHRFITGQFVAIAGAPGVLLRLPRHWGLTGVPMACLLLGFGALWYVVGNLYLFQNSRRTWQAMMVMVVATSFYLGVGTVVLAAQLILLLLPRTRAMLSR